MGKRIGLRGIVGLLWLGFLAGGAWAHFLIAVPPEGQGYGLRGQVINIWVLFGHPFEGILYDLKAPKGFMLKPEGQKDRLSFSRIEVKDYASGRKRFGYRIEYLPTARGDYYLCLQSQPYLNQEEGEVWEDRMKTPLHVQVEKGWQNLCGFELEIQPLSRPYGLRVGQVFRGRVLLNGKPLPGAQLEVEKLNGFYVPEEKLPLDAYGRVNEPLITFVLKTDKEGFFEVGFPEGGWWVVNVAVPAGKAPYANRTFPRMLRSGIWLYVFETPALAPTGFPLFREVR
ncbi:DUF4198 domain-containing protein [Thermosulfurimonas marina]|uniref:DUF4198 domain-containing protein n=1 Tax=Thermosulfurimonas marina TaxID=2047767 RepID=A0A6H1WTT6_9BACT|nr:DUF4198 domain-containing protein [Thermosulfurimonas marina]QJA06635.1 DUF4198 domain-containing protein [Thermosulfurimonas marina]